MTAATTPVPRNWHLAEGARLPQGDVLLFDLDGVLADAGHRQHFLHLADPDWGGFYAGVVHDTPLASGASLAAAMHPDLPLVILTGRVDAVADATIRWLTAHGVRWDLLICRPPDDSDAVTHAVDFKRVEVRRLLDSGIRPVLAVDDNRKIVAMYEEFAIPALYLPSGYYDDLARYDGGV
jgi:hypothetical protein